MIRILFARPTWAIGSSFVKTDLELLRRHFEVTPMVADGRDRLLPLRFLKAMRSHDLCFVWFADAHALPAAAVCRLLRKPCVIVPGQYELVAYPEAGYGLRLESLWRWRQGMLALRHASRVLAVSRYHQTLLQRCGVPSDRLRLAYHGFDGDAFLAPTSAKELIVATVAHCASSQRIWHKGLDAFAAAAALVPEARFVIAGGYTPDTAAYLQKLAGGRLELLGSMDTDGVIQLLGISRVYAQLSATESFGCALAEAMLCECIPVVTNRGALPEVVGDLGFVVDYGDPEGAAQAIRQALKATHGKQCRERIMNLFPLSRREEALVETIEELTAPPKLNGAGPQC